MSSSAGAQGDWGPSPVSSASASASPGAEQLDDMPEEHWLAAMATLALGEHNGTRDFSAPILKPIVSNVYPVFVLQYGLLILVGTVANVLLFHHVLRHRLYRDVTHALFLNLLLSNCVQCLVVLPMTLTVLLVQNWVLGRFFCFFMPMLQDIPLHVCMLTHLLIAWDRLRWLGDPLKCRLPAFVCSCGTWLAGIVITLPYPIYINYIDLGTYLPQFQGADFCTVNLVDDMHEYMRGLFLSLYCAPTILLSYLYIHTSRELKPPEGPLGVMLFEAREEARNRHRRSQVRVPKDQTLSGGPPKRSYDLYDAERDVSREKRTQQFLCSMAAVHVICISPLMVLRLARLVLEETYDNSGHFDLTFLMFVWIAYLPTVVNPWIYATWILSRPTKERLRGYLRLSSKQRTPSSSSQPEAEEIATEAIPKKRNSEGSALTTLSSVRSTTTGVVQGTKPRTSHKASAQFQFQSPTPPPLLAPVSLQSSTCNLTDTSSCLERDLEIIDLLERERSMDIQQGLQRERERERQELGRRRQLPNVLRHVQGAHSQCQMKPPLNPPTTLLIPSDSTTRPEYAMLPQGKGIARDPL